MSEVDEAMQEGFQLGRPALVCRWRLAGARLPMANRHMRALGERAVLGSRLSAQLLAWVKQHIEWTLADGAAEHPDGVLMLVVDEKGRAAMSVGPYEGLASTTTEALVERARATKVEALRTGVAPETLWAVSGDALVWGAAPQRPASATGSLMGDLARTLGIPVRRDDALAEEVAADPAAYEEVFLVSDEHGVVPARDASGARALKFAQGYERLLDRTARL